MSLSDPVADYLSRIRNAISAKHDKVDIPASKVKLEMTRILKEEGFIQNYKVQEGKVRARHFPSRKDSMEQKQVDVWIC